MRNTTPLEIQNKASKLRKRQRRFLSLTGFSVIEYAILVAILVAALIAMSVYLRRSLCGKWREAGDSFGFGRQYQGR